MKLNKNICRLSVAGVLSIAALMPASAQGRRGEGGGHNSGARPEGGSAHFNRPQNQNSAAQSRPEFHQPTREIRTQPQMPVASQPIRPQQNFPSASPAAPRIAHVRHNTPSPSTAPAPTNTAPSTARSPLIRNTPRNGTPAPVQNNFRPQPSPPQANNFRPVGAPAARGGYGYGYRGYTYNRPPVVNTRFYYGGAYHPHPYYYRPFRPYWGIHIDVLPVGYYGFYAGPSRYYYHHGIFYRPFGGYYETIIPPLGVYIPLLPEEAYPIVINNNNYYEYQGTYYRRDLSGAERYEVVGVNGYLKSDLPPVSDSDSGDIISDSSIQPAANTAPAQPLTIIPENFKTVTLNNIVYYVSPSGEYYTKNIDDEGKVTYTVAALETPGK